MPSPTAWVGMKGAKSPVACWFACCCLAWHRASEGSIRLRNAQHIVDVGFEENKLPAYQTPCPGVLMCNFSQIYPMDRGTNYCVRDGNRMAERLLAGWTRSEEQA